MLRKRFTHPLTGALAALLALLISPALLAQSTIDTGSLRGRITDDKGGPLPGALVKAKGPQGIKASEADANGNYSIGFLTPGLYDVTVSMDQFNTVQQTGVEIVAQRTSQLPIKLASGGGEIVVVKGAGTRVDTTATTSQTSVNLATAIETFARDRSLTSTFDFSPGVVANSGVGGGNPSISGASGLENQYLIGGVNITNTGYGGIGAYDSVGGAQGVGVTTDFLEDLDIREGGFEAEYGGALGGVISASIKSGSNDFHGAIQAYYTPRTLEGSRRNLYVSGGIGNSRGDNTLDASVQLGGPIIKEKLFFFVAYNPVWSKHYTQFDIEPADIAKDFPGIVQPLPNANREYDFGTNRVNNYAAHLTWNITDKHKLDFIAFGSPSAINGPLRGIGRRVHPADDPGIPVNPPTVPGVPDTDPVAGAMRNKKITDRSFSLKYFGTFASWINVEAQVSYHLSEVTETPGPGADVMFYNDIRRTQIFNAQIANAGRSCNPAHPSCNPPTIPVPSPPIVTGAQYSFGGLGLFQGGSHDQNIAYTLKITHNFNLWGSHELKWGGEYADLTFRENPIRSGPRDENGPEVYLHIATNPFPPPTLYPDPSSFVRIRTGASAQVRCDIVRPDRSAPFGGGNACPFPRYRLNRGNFNPATLDTTNKELNFFLQDKWTLSNYITLNLGVRYTRSKLANPTNFSLRSTRDGAPLLDPAGVPVGTRDEACIAATAPGNPDCYTAGLGDFVGSSYAFKGEWAPRVGIAWDLLGNGKTKLYANYARMFERIPQDLAIRSFGNEIGLVRANFVNPDLTFQFGPSAIVGGNSTAVAPGTRLPYKDDFILGYQFEVAPRFLIDIKGTYRMQGRVLEDTQAATVESLQNYYYSYRFVLGACTNCLPGQMEPFPGSGFARFGQYVLANVGENGPSTFPEVYPAFTGPCPQHPTALVCDGLPTGATTPVSFGQPSSKYQALSLTATKQKAEGGHLSIQATYRIAKLWGNYEGLYRNDNGQGDPNISALFDFPNSHLTRSQYTNGRLNTDTPHALRINVGYDDLLIKNLSAAVTFKWNSGQLRTPYLAHPFYQNAGEIPGGNPQYYTFDTSCFAGVCLGFNNAFMLKDYTAASRGANGRNADIATWDFKLGYRWNLGKSNLDFSVLVANAFNENGVTRFNEFVETQTAILNPLYGVPLTVHEPRTIRLGAKWSF